MNSYFQLGGSLLLGRPGPFLLDRLHLSEIRSNPEISDITVVIMTTADATFHFGINDLGAKLFITKPMDVQRLCPSHTLYSGNPPMN